MNETNKTLSETISEHLTESSEVYKQNELPPVELKATIPGLIDQKIELAHLYSEFRLSEQRVSNGIMNEMEPGARYIRDLNVRKIAIIREKFDSKFKDLLGVEDISELNDLDEAFAVLEEAGAANSENLTHWEEVDQIGDAFVIHKGKHVAGETSSLAGQTHYGVKIRAVYADKKEAQAHADTLNQGRGYKPEDQKDPAVASALYQVSPKNTKRVPGVPLNEKAPPGMEDWVKGRKEDFKERYGDRWEEVLYRTAWKMYNKKEEAEQIDEIKGMGPNRKTKFEKSFVSPKAAENHLKWGHTVRTRIDPDGKERKYIPRLWPHEGSPGGVFDINEIPDSHLDKYLPGRDKYGHPDIHKMYNDGIKNGINAWIKKQKTQNKMYPVKPWRVSKEVEQVDESWRVAPAPILRHVDTLANYFSNTDDLSYSGKKHPLTPEVKGHIKFHSSQIKKFNKEYDSHIEDAAGRSGSSRRHNIAHNKAAEAKEEIRNHRILHALHHFSPKVLRQFKAANRASQGDAIGLRYERHIDTAIKNLKAGGQKPPLTKPAMREEVEQINELSPETLTSYVSKAAAKRSKIALAAGIAQAQEKDPSSIPGVKGINTTRTGIERALDRLPDSVRKNYIRRAITNLDATSAGAGVLLGKGYPKDMVVRGPVGKKMTNRMTGIRRALNRKEVEQIDEESAHLTVTKLKADGKHEEAGAAAFEHGLGRKYGPHFGLRSNKDKAEAAFHRGYDTAEMQSRKKVDKEVEQISGSVLSKLRAARAK
jgi:hypothetical protein